ncbi:MAG: DNA mismatch repair endonuclease MutL [Desulfosalsimonadaceae bacterium]
MSRIRVLPEILSNKIAAGEVVERPASVVKELVENAIDAASSRITVEVGQGGRSLIRVSDNGCGMSRDDALLAIERYATSKIYEDSDLYAISTLGFRGEALPSIAAVSRLELITREQHEEAGTRIYVEGGSIKKVEHAGAPAGTLISAGHIFFNTPARRKFLKTVNTEMGHIADVVSAIALAWEKIQFRLFHNERGIKNWAAADSSFDRIVDVLGAELRYSLHQVEAESRRLAVSGWVSEPEVTRSTPQKLYIYINGRFIRDRGITYALLDGYKGRLMKGRFPVGALFLQLPPAEVDVNVHPTKHEVRFARQKEVYELVRSAVASAFSRPRQNRAHVAPPASEVRETPGLWQEPAPQPNKPAPGPEDAAVFSQTPPASPSPEAKPGPEPPPQSSRPLFRDKPCFARMRIIGQFRNTYIICETEDALCLIDQHAAHERIVYEKLVNHRKQSEAHHVQTLAVPETIELNYKESAALSELIPELENIGITVEPFGGHTFIVKSLPAVLADKSAVPLVTELAETAAEAGYTPGVEEGVHACLTVMACHGAIRANQALSEMEIRALLEQLDRCDNPYNCPHGRPTLVEWPLHSLEKRFHRIV